MIQLDGGDLHRKVDEAILALADANDPAEPTVLVRGNALVRMTERGELEEYTSITMCDSGLSQAAVFYRNGKHGPVAKDPPSLIANAVLGRDSGAYGGLPRVDRVVDVPVVGKDGTLVTRPGYHPESRLYYCPAEGLEDLRIPTSDDVAFEDALRAARNFLLDELLGDFGFDDEASRAHALGLLLLPFVREHIGDGPTPMHGIFAHEPGVGKGYLAQACLIPGCGMVAVTPGAAEDDAEWRKVITSSLLGGIPALIFDNLHGTLKSASLASALTTGEWRDRVLGSSRMVTLPVRNAWVATANNPAMSDEQARRVVPIFLDAGDVRPSDREATAFRHADLHGWALENRRELVEAALVLVQHWLAGPVEVMAPSGEFLRGQDIDGQAADPRSGKRTLGSFQRWARTVGGIVEDADQPGFLENRDRLDAEVNEERREAAEFLRAWQKSESEPLLIKELLARCTTPGDPVREALPSDLAAVANRSEALHPKLARWLQEYNQQRCGGYQLVAQARSGKGGRRRWIVQSRG